MGSLSVGSPRSLSISPFPSYSGLLRLVIIGVSCSSFVVLTCCHVFYPDCFHYFLLHPFIVRLVPFHFLLPSLIPSSIIVLLLK